MLVVVLRARAAGLDLLACKPYGLDTPLLQLLGNIYGFYPANRAPSVLSSMWIMSPSASPPFAQAVWFWFLVPPKGGEPENRWPPGSRGTDGTGPGTVGRSVGRFGDVGRLGVRL